MMKKQDWHLVVVIITILLGSGSCSKQLPFYRSIEIKDSGNGFTHSAVVSTLSKNKNNNDQHTTKTPGIYYDKKKKRYWTSHSASTSMQWQKAEHYCQDLSLVNNNQTVDDWRLPSIQELNQIYSPEKEQVCGTVLCHLSIPLHLDTPYVWSGSSPEENRRFYFDFRFGTQLAPLLKPLLKRQVICTRDKKS